MCTHRLAHHHVATREKTYYRTETWVTTEQGKEGREPFRLNDWVLLDFELLDKDSNSEEDSTNLVGQKITFKKDKEKQNICRTASDIKFRGTYVNLIGESPSTKVKLRRLYSTQHQDQAFLGVENSLAMVNIAMADSEVENSEQHSLFKRAKENADTSRGTHRFVLYNGSPSTELLKDKYDLPKEFPVDVVSRSCAACCFVPV